jgi:uncharacterized protein (DUF885 family)
MRYRLLSVAVHAAPLAGVQEHHDLRRAVEAKEGEGFDLKRCHDRVLSYGAPPVRRVRHLMLGEPIR